MTVPGDATEVGSIVAYLAMNREDWTRGRRATEEDAARLGRLNPDIRISTNADTVIARLAAVRAAERGIGKDAHDAKPFVMNLWAALAAVAPAAVPIAGVLGGAAIGLIPVVAALALGIQGITKDIKKGTLEGTAYGRTLDTIVGETHRLQQIAAGGILNGLNRGLDASHGLFGTVNQDVGVMAGQLGNVIAGGMPALLRLLTQLNPLFVTFGDLVTRGATELEAWSQHSTGVSHFVAYVQTELPQVMQFLGNLIVLFSHLAQAAAPFGGTLLTGLNLLVTALDAIPIGVLQTAIPLVVSLYVALKAYQGITAVMAGVSTGIGAVTAKIAALDAVETARATAATAAALQVQAAAEAEAAVVAHARAAEATAAAEAAAAVAAASGEMDSLFGSTAGAATAASSEMAAAFAGMGSLFASEADVVAAAAAEEAAAFQAVAAAAIASAETIAAEAAAAAEASASAGAAAGVGWSAMLGPVGAVVAGVGLFTAALWSNHSAAVAEQAQINALTDALKQDSGAVGENTRAYIVNALQKSGALDDARQLKLNLDQVADAASGNKQALAALNDQLGILSIGTYGATKDTHDQVAAAKDLQTILNGTSGDVAKAKQAYDNEADAMGRAAKAAVAQKSALDALNTSLQTIAQTELGMATTEDQFLESLHGVTAAVKTNGETLSKHTSKGLANRDALLSSLQAALSYKDAQQKAGVSVGVVTRTLADNVRQLEQTAIHAGLSKDAVHKLIHELGLTPSHLLTELRVSAPKAHAEIKALQDHIDSIRQGKIPNLDANSALGKATIADLQAHIDAIRQGKKPSLDADVKAADAHLAAMQAHIDNLHGKTVDITVNTVLSGHRNDPSAPGHAASGTPSSPPGEMWVGEEGPELLKLPGGSQITPTRQSMARAAVNSASADGAAYGVSPADLRAALHGVKIVVDAGSVGTLTGHIDARADLTVSGNRARRTALAGMNPR